MDLGISGKRALVLGASRGLGAAVAAALAAEGVHVLAGARNLAAIKASELIEPIHIDLRDSDSVGALIDVVRGDGGIDILVNNSGGPSAGPAKGQPSGAWADALNAMASPLFAITDGCLDHMIAGKWGRVITIGSSGVVQPIANLGLSNGIRGAIAGWSKTLAGEVAQHGVTVNMVIPGRIDTDRVGELDRARAERTGATIEDVRKASQAEIPIGRYGTPQEFAAVVTFLASTQASYVTGSIVRADGGMIKAV